MSILSKKDGVKRGPVYIEDINNIHEKHSFCDIRTFPKYGFQKFKKVKGSVRYNPESKVR